MSSSSGPPTPPPPPDIPLAEAIRTAKFWALVTACVSFFLYGGQLNLHLPTILTSESGKSAIEAAVVFSTYNGFCVAGKLLTGVFITVPSLKRSVPLYLPFPLLFCLSHLLLLTVDVPKLLNALRGGGWWRWLGWSSRNAVLEAFGTATGMPRLLIFAATAGLSYGFGASLMQLLVREFFGLRDLTRLQPIVFGAVIVGNMGGMFLPGLMHDVYGTYCASLLMSFGATLVTMCCFVTMFFQHPFGTTPPRDTVEGARGTTVPTASSSGPSVDAMPPPQRFSRKVGRWWKGIVDGGRGPAREILM